MEYYLLNTGAAGQGLTEADTETDTEAEAETEWRAVHAPSSVAFTQVSRCGPA